MRAAIQEPVHQQFYSIDHKYIAKMEQQTYHLNEFPSIYKKIESDKKKMTLKGLDFIIQLNKDIGVDEILLRSAFASYQNKKDLQSKHTQQSCETFFKYLVKNLNELESNYLRDTSDAKLIEQAQHSNQKQYNFLLNKNSVSKFIRDQAAHYQRVLEKYLEIVDEADEEKEIKTTNIHNFLVELFTSKHTMIIHQNQDYLKRPLAEIQVDVGHHLLQYGKKCKEMSEQQAQQEYSITQEEILDFLTFWLKEESKIFILYTRTQQRLRQQSKMIANQSQLEVVVHPSRMNALEIIKKTDAIETAKKQQQISKSRIEEKQVLPQKIQEQSFHPVHKTLPMKTENNQSKQQERKASQVKPIKRCMTRQDLLKRQMKGLFEFGCKRRYKMNKNTTFEGISEQSRTMNLVKFVFFCNFFQLNELITRELMTQYFKMYAINTRILEFQGFEKVIVKMIAFDEKIRENLLKKSTFQIKQKLHHINKDKKSEGRLSGYKFMLHPINGKDVSTIQTELTFRKLQKMIIRQEKQKLALNKREELEKTPPKITSRVVPSYSTSKVSPAQLQPIRDIAFNPEKLISHGDNDKLWEAYEAKIWSKDQRSPNTLQSILSKRIERGNIVINKLNSQRSFIYDP